jgi:hypothetical protein
VSASVLQPPALLSIDLTLSFGLRCDYPYPTGFLAPLPAWPVNVACKIMTSGSGQFGSHRCLLSGSEACGRAYAVLSLTWSPMQVPRCCLSWRRPRVSSTTVSLGSDRLLVSLCDAEWA